LHRLDSDTRKDKMGRKKKRLEEWKENEKQNK
jgi:hypothetical protein